MWLSVFVLASCLPLHFLSFPPAHSFGHPPPWLPFLASLFTLSQLPCQSGELHYAGLFCGCLVDQPLTLRSSDAHSTLLTRFPLLTVHALCASGAWKAQRNPFD